MEGVRKAALMVEILQDRIRVSEASWLFDLPSLGAREAHRRVLTAESGVRADARRAHSPGRQVGLRCFRPERFRAASKRAGRRRTKAGHQPFGR